jgi:hypothetical protein
MGVLIFDFSLSIFTFSRKAETFKKSGLDRKLQRSHRISLTTPYLVYILSNNTQYIDIGGLFDFFKGPKKGGEKEKVMWPLF